MEMNKTQTVTSSQYEGVRYIETGHFNLVSRIGESLGAAEVIDYHSQVTQSLADSVHSTGILHIVWLSNPVTEL
jgi:hypothetical protein